MRIISGNHKGRIIHAPENLPTRPTTDFAKTGLFNILNFRFRFENLVVLDLFAGTGSISYEFLSRNCKSLIAVDAHLDCVNFIKKTNRELKFENASVIKADVFDFLNSQHLIPADIIFADPPFDLHNYPELINLLFEKKILKPSGVFILEHQSKNHFTENKYFKEERKYGNITFSFFKE